MKNYKILGVFNIVIFVYILLLSVGYAFFSESLTIGGVASTVDYYSGKKLPVEPIIMDTANNRYHTMTGYKPFIDFYNETWDGEKYSLFLEKKIGISIGKVTSNYKVSFSNPTNVTYKNGRVETKIINNYHSRIISANAIISKTELKPGEILEVNLEIVHNFYSELGSNNVEAIITFDCQNSPKRFMFYVEFGNGTLLPPKDNPTPQTTSVK